MSRPHAAVVPGVHTGGPDREHSYSTGSVKPSTARVALDRDPGGRTVGSPGEAG